MRRWLAAIVVLGCLASVAHAGRKRVAVLVDGPSADKIRGEIVKLIQKAHAVVKVDAWKRTAKALAATRINTANVRKVARKLDVDAVIEASVTERRGGFRVRVRLRSGASGQTIEEVNATTNGTTFDKASRRDLRDEVIDVISTIADDDVQPPKKRKNR